MIDIGMRIILGQLITSFKCNFFVIDEGFVHFDADRLELVDHIFDLLRNTFDFTLIISHLEKLNESVDIQYNVKKENGRSAIAR